MDAILTDVNWLAVGAGTIAAFALGMLWFGPLFGKAWAAGSHGISRPEQIPVAAMALQLCGTFLMAWIVGATETQNSIMAAIVAILAIAVLLTAGSLFSQKSVRAALIDGGFVLAMGIVMILAQGVF
jgi:hypothetical protein